MNKTHEPSVKMCEQCYVFMPVAKHQCDYCGYLTNAGVRAMERKQEKRK